MLRLRLYLGLLSLVLVVIGTGAYAIVVCRQLAGSLEQELVSHYGHILSSQQMRAAASAMANSLEAARHNNPVVARRIFEGARAVFNRGLMDQSGSSAGTPRSMLVDKLDAAFQPFEHGCEELVKAGGQGTLEAIQENESNLFAINRAIDQLTQFDYDASSATSARARQLADTTEDILLAAIAIAFVLSLLLGWRLAASILKPLKALTSSVVAVGEGNLDTNVPVFSKDELGVLAGSFNTMASKLRSYREATLARVLRTQRTMEATLTSVPDPVFVVSRNGTHEVRNPAAVQLSQSDDLAKGFPPGIAEPLARVLETGEHYLPTDYRRIVTLRIMREDRHYLPRILAIGDKLTEFVGAAVILQDVTKFRLLDDAKTNLVGTVSHELKTPLTSLRMAVYLMLEENLGRLNAQQRELLETARDDSDRLLRILDSLLDLARLEAGASDLNRREMPVEEILAGVAGEGRGIVAAAGQTLDVAGEEGLGSISVDFDRLRHVFTNLLTNASKYSPADTRIVVRAESAPLGFVRFSVRDSGTGIPEEARSRVFDRFYRVPGQSKPGAGIGLAIAREIVVAHGGSIGVSEADGGGCEFYFLLPRG